MRIGVPKETEADERRVGLVPDAVGRLVRSGHQVQVERGAGVSAHFPDAEYEAAGAALAGREEVFGGADLLVKVRRPTEDEAGRLKAGGAVAGLLQPYDSETLLGRLAERRVTGFAMELVPRTTKAQSMDVLSSQATVAGYKAVLLGASNLSRLLPMLTTAAGTLAPAKAFVVGAGVAGLQAIATARRLGAVVSAFDVRPVVKEQVESLGATFLEGKAAAEGAGGYARELDADERRRVEALIAGHVPAMNLVITTAAVPGKRAPCVITEEMVRAMRLGSVIVDLAAEGGGNCALTRAGQTVEAHGVTILGPVNLAATVPMHASQMYSRNLLTFIQHVAPDGSLAVDLEDPITGAMCVTHLGEVRHGRAA